MTDKDKLFCVLYGPYEEGKETRWSILEYKETEGKAREYALGVKDGISVGDLLAVVFIDDIVDLYSQCKWLGIVCANRDKTLQVITAPYGSQYARGKSWMAAFHCESYGAYTLLCLIRRIDKIKLLETMLSCIAVSFKKEAYENNSAFSGIRNMVSEGKFNDLDMLQMKQGLDYTISCDEYMVNPSKGEEKIAASRCIGIVLDIAYGEYESKNYPYGEYENEEVDVKYMEALKLFCNLSVRMNDEVEDEVCYIIKSAESMPVVILSHVWQTP